MGGVYRPVEDQLSAGGAADWAAERASGRVVAIDPAELLGALPHAEAVTRLAAWPDELVLTGKDAALADDGTGVGEDASADDADETGGEREEPPFPPGVIDTVLLVLADGELGEVTPGTALVELTSLLAPAGRLVAVVPAPETSGENAQRGRGWRLELAASGLDLTTVELGDGWLRLVAVAGAAEHPPPGTETAERALLDAEARAGAPLRDVLVDRTRALAAARRDARLAESRAVDAKARVQRFEARNDKLVTDRDELRARLVEAHNLVALERWKLRSMRNRKIWRLAVAVKQALRSPLALLALPVTVLRLLLRPGTPVPKPAPKPKPAAEARPPEQRAVAAEVARTARLDVARQRLLAPPPAHRLSTLRLAGVLDEMSAACFAPECELLTFRPDNWEAVLSEREPNLLLVESAWKGNRGAWEYQVGTYSYTESVGLPQLSALVDWCRARDIPTVFWNKEDPVHFKRFREAAALFDVILTSDADRIPAYEALGGRARTIDALPFAAQPALHNPISLAQRRPEPVFAGTFYRNRHPERQRQLEALLDAAAPHGLVIYDRMRGEKTDAFGFPDRFDDHLVAGGGVPYDEMVEVYKQHKVFLNANSVTASPTMFSRRVFELLACGTAVVSTPSVGVERLLGDVVHTVADPATAGAVIDRLVTDDDHWRAVSAAGIRRVFAEHTYAHRLAQIVDAAGFGKLDVRPDERITVVALADAGAPAFEALTTALVTQTQPPAEVVVGHDGSAGERAGERLAADVGAAHGRVLAQDAAAGELARYRELATLASSPWVAVVDPEAAVSADLLAGLLAATRFAEADVIGLPAKPGGPVWRYVDDVAPHAALVRRDVLAARGWPAGDERAARLADWRAEGVRLFAADAG